jgi:hypothetical protein
MSDATFDRVLTRASRAAARAALAMLALGAGVATAAEVRGSPGEPALAAGSQGLYPSTDFRAVSGDCSDCATLPQARWYFKKDLIAVPRPGVEIAGMTRGITAQEDVRRWFAGGGRDAARPSLVWIGSPDLIVNARLDPAGRRLTLPDGSEASFRLTAKIPENRSYYDAKTTAFFSRRSLRIRGRVEEGAGGARAVEARTIWPEDYVFDFARMKPAPLGAGETLDALVRREVDGTRDRFETRLLWERNPGAARAWDGRAVLGVLLNGAQGDDDEAHGGHFAIVTGRFGPGGQWADWMVNNFYNLDSFSEKGIVAAMVPMDNYQMDLNSGQSYYRPSYMLVAVLKSDRAAYAYQGAIQRVFNRFYRHDFVYDHAAANCAGISIETLRSLGWNIPERGPTSYLKAVAAYPYMSVKEMSLESGRKAYAYLKEEQTRLYPAVAFSAIGGDLLELVGAVPGRQREASAFEKVLREDVEAILYVRIPQLPSSRAYGTFPVASIDEYMKRVPEDKSKWQVVPVDPRPFPAEFDDAEALHAGASGAYMGVTALIVLSGCGLVGMAIRRRARRSISGKASG